MGFADNFNDNSFDTVRWVKQTLETQNLSVTVLEQNARLEIQPLTSTAGVNFNGARTVNTYNLTGAQVIVKVPQVCSGANADTQFMLEIDSNNFYCWVVENGTIYRKKKVGGVSSNTNEAYNATNHLYWRIWHDVSNDHIKWDTSLDGASWTNKRDIARDLTITSMKIEVNAGTFASDAAPGAAYFDDFRLVTPGVPPWLFSGDD